MTFPFRRKVDQQYLQQHLLTDDTPPPASCARNVSSSGMYTAFLLDSADQLKYRLYTAPKFDGQDDLLGPTDNPNNNANDPATVVQVGNDSAADAGKGANAGKMPNIGCLKLTRRTIHILNLCAAALHAILFIVIYFQAVGKGKQGWYLKQDRVQVVPKNVSDSRPFVNITNDKCNMAKPNLMNFTGSGGEGMSLQLWVYPQVEQSASCHLQ